MASPRESHLESHRGKINTGACTGSGYIETAFKTPGPGSWPRR